MSGRIPLHDHSGPNSGGPVQGAMVVYAAGLTVDGGGSSGGTAGYGTPVATGTALSTGSSSQGAASDHVHTNTYLGTVAVSGTAVNGYVLTATSASAASWTAAGTSAAAVITAWNGTVIGTATVLNFVNGTAVYGSGTTSYTAPAGGGGGGNVSTGTAITIDYGRAQLLTVRAATNTEDDHFDAGTGSLNAKWLAYTGLDMSYSLSALPGWLKATSAGVKLQAVPAGDWTIETEVIVGDIGAAAYFNSGLCLTSGTTYATSDMETWYSGQENSLTSYRWTVEKFHNGAYSSTQSTWTARGFGYPVRVVLAINKSGTTYNFLYSAVGTLAGSNAGPFQRFYQIASLGFTPTHFGLYSAGSGTLFNYFLRY